MFPIGIADSFNSVLPLLRFYRILHSSFGQYLDCYFGRSTGVLSHRPLPDQLTVFQGASEVPISESYGSSEQRRKTANWPRPGGLR